MMAIPVSNNIDRESADASTVSPIDGSQDVQSYQTFPKGSAGDSDLPPRDSVTESAGDGLTGEDATGTGGGIAVRRRDRIFAYIKTRDFWIVLVLG
jgi:hypothetical protein